MARFATYFEDTWIKSWSIADWCVFLCSIRTNNTLEGLNNNGQFTLAKIEPVLLEIGADKASWLH